MVINQALQKEINKHARLIETSTREVNRLRAALNALNGNGPLKPKSKSNLLHWTQRPENKDKVAKRIKLMQKAKRS